jgi:hypothetical protein
MIQVFSGMSGPVVAVMLATLPALIGVQARSSLASNRRRRQLASPHSKATRDLIKVLSLANPPTTTE